MTRTCVAPGGRFIYGIHRPAYRVKNLRINDYIRSLGIFPDGRLCDNRRNFPAGDLEENDAAWIYEIPNPFPFRGATFIKRDWAERCAEDPAAIALPARPETSFSGFLRQFTGQTVNPEQLAEACRNLPRPMLLALAAASTNPDDLVCLARQCCEFNFDNHGQDAPAGLSYQKDAAGGCRAVIRDHELFEVLVNNEHLPAAYREPMVLRPGAQGESEIVGEWLTGEGSHIFEYLRRNSYIPWGHYAANMANDCIRYNIGDLTASDIRGLRHLYYQRTYVRLAEDLGLARPSGRTGLSETELEAMRLDIKRAVQADPEISLPFNASLWGWNFGFDYAAGGYRLHASHQQIHQQYAMLPARFRVRENGEEDLDPPPVYACGDLIADCITEYRKTNGRDFFNDYMAAIRGNRRLDNNKGRESSLIIYEDENVMLFVPKAQTSQWELQIMTIGPVGNILEADAGVRASLDQTMLLAMRILTIMGARMISVIEYSSRFDAADRGQRLLYAFLPKLPQSPGAFSEAQLRWIVGHYPEDFARACRARLAELTVTNK